ncbi:MAG: hypothetical protein IT479_11530 [Xanthomonadales bacterium]|nr:hypothetical protein [Xanthomonadales bacterium]MCC6593892.1 hypothetical protein [Xanthomonadales bacterium]MCE7932099.1 hypothetical protein [Xanthomonadales bacterium PRO6]
MHVRITVCLLLAGLQAVAAETPSSRSFEINQDCAETGCFPGDGPGLPVTINAPGRYHLTSHLALPSASYGILVQNTYGHVTIDLGGMTISGKNTCSGQPVTRCDWDGGSGYGIAAYRPESLTIRNGSIAGIWGTGVNVGTWGEGNQGRVQLQDLVVEQSSDTGARLHGSTLQLERVKLHQNRYDGLMLEGHERSQSAITVRSSDLIGNGGYGLIVFSDQAFIEESTFLSNGSFGLINGGVFTRSLFSGNNGGGQQIYNNGPSDMGGNRCGTRAPYTCLSY